ncbi:hypothetical protein EB796_008333 [Bugula neritina]|uniref:Uncharacterized protein n=1 Tax=Bugula neritina TaxID=10212 RepID=A0A7J7K405_BUGNE|nr:hypothetical protein EB796_008333 [Bugula neritina]
MGMLRAVVILTENPCYAMNYTSMFTGARLELGINPERYRAYEIMEMIERDFINNENKDYNSVLFDVTRLANEHSQIAFTDKVQGALASAMAAELHEMFLRDIAGGNVYGIESIAEYVTSGTVGSTPSTTSRSTTTPVTTTRLSTTSTLSTSSTTSSSTSTTTSPTTTRPSSTTTKTSTTTKSTTKKPTTPKVTQQQTTAVLQPDGLVPPAVTNVRASTLKKESKKKKDSAGFANPMYFDTKINLLSLIEDAIQIQKQLFYHQIKIKSKYRYTLTHMMSFCTYMGSKMDNHM